MKKHLVFSVLIASLMAVAAYAGPDKTVVPPVGEGPIGVPYFAPVGGVNAFQDGLDSPGGISSSVGGWGGLKGGYIFLNTGWVRPAVEFEGFYNGFDQEVHIVGCGNETFNASSGVFMVNGFARFHLGVVEPYVGAGMGGYVADCSEKGGMAVNSLGDHGSWAWQLMAGVDYYLTPGISIFTEYKFLNFMNANEFIPTTSNSRLGQQLVGAGVRFQF